MLDTPIFTLPLDSEIAGDDPLGIAPTNERMFGNVFPGVNNVVRYIRVYALIAWTVNLIEEHLQRHEGELAPDEVNELSKNALQRIQLALLWRNTGRKMPQLAGSTRKFPVHNKPVRLTFADLGPIRADLLDPGAYRPSLTGGLGFLLRDPSGKLYACTEDAGRALAAAYDQVARTSKRYRWLSDVTALTTRRADLFTIENALDLTQVSRDEQRAFISRFFPEPTEGALDQYAENRWFAIHLALRAVDLICREKERAGEHSGATADEVRSCMARAGFVSAPLRIDGLEGVQALWAVLQVRQLQRLALDVLYCIVERWLAHRSIAGARLGVDELAAEIGDSVTPILADEFRTSMAAFVAACEESQAGHTTLYEAALEGDDEYADVFGHVKALLEVSLEADELAQALVPVLEALAFCTVEASNLQRHTEARAVIAQDLDQCSLQALIAFFRNRGRLRPADFLKVLVKQWVILRHFDVASGRSQRGTYKNRFRFVLGDEGLERFNPAAPLMERAMGADRLDHILILCRDAGILDGGEEDGYLLTPYGLHRIAEL